MSKKKVLGRGLSSFLSESVDLSKRKNVKSNEQLNIPIEFIKPNPDQPRKHFNFDELKELSETVDQKGILQPLIVVKKNETDYIIVAGERRWRAAQLAQIHELPVIIKELTDQEIIEIAIIENVQRSQLNPLEEANGYLKLVEEHNYSHEQVAKLVGKSRPYVSNVLRLLSLPDEVKKFIKDGQITSGHARSLLNCENPINLSRLIIKKGLSVRQTELLAKREKKETSQNNKEKYFKQKDLDTKELEDSLSAELKLNVKIIYSKNKKSGKLNITYNNNEELARICDILKRQI